MMPLCVLTRNDECSVEVQAAAAGRGPREGWRWFASLDERTLDLQVRQVGEGRPQQAGGTSGVGTGERGAGDVRVPRGPVCGLNA